MNWQETYWAIKARPNNKKRIVKYEISGDGVGLLAYLGDGNFYHIHSNELTEEEKAILISLSKKVTPYQRLVEKGKTYEIRGT
jgi:hypothetical protein